MATVQIKTVRSSEETKQKMLQTLLKHLPLDYEDKIVLNYIQRYKNTDKNGNSRYNYSFYGMDRDTCRIADMTWQIANILELRYDYNRMFIVDDEGLQRYVVSKLNVLADKLNYKEITAKEVI